jgi:N12 class adenine-specific DNA methylase
MNRNVVDSPFEFETEEPKGTPSSGDDSPFEFETSSPTRKRKATTGKSDLDSLYEQAASEHGVDPDLLIEQARQESVNFNPRFIYHRGATSPKGAGGIAQFMPDTARAYGLKVDDSVDERYDPAKAIPAQARMMRELIDRHQGNVEAALAAYNSGSNRSTQSALRARQRIPETRTYVDRITGKLKTYQAEQWKQDETQPGDETPNGDFQPGQVVEIPNRQRGKNSSPTIEVRVRPGDNTKSIAERFNVSPQDIHLARNQPRPTGKLSSVSGDSPFEFETSPAEPEQQQVQPTATPITPAAPEAVSSALPSVSGQVLPAAPPARTPPVVDPTTGRVTETFTPGEQYFLQSGQGLPQARGRHAGQQASSAPPEPVTVTYTPGQGAVTDVPQGANVVTGRERTVGPSREERRAAIAQRRARAAAQAEAIRRQVLGQANQLTESVRDELSRQSQGNFEKLGLNMNPATNPATPLPIGPPPATPPLVENIKEMRRQVAGRVRRQSVFPNFSPKPADTPHTSELLKGLDLASGLKPAAELEGVAPTPLERAKLEELVKGNDESLYRGLMLRGGQNLNDFWSKLAGIAGDNSVSKYFAGLSEESGREADLSLLNERKRNLLLHGSSKQGTMSVALEDLGQTAPVLMKYHLISSLITASGGTATPALTMGLVAAIENKDKPVVEQLLGAAMSAGEGGIIGQFGKLGRVPAGAAFGAYSAGKSAAAGEDVQHIFGNLISGTAFGAGMANSEGIKARELPKELAGAAIRSNLTPEYAKDVIAGIGKFGKGVVYSSDGRAISLYADPETGRVFGNQITEAEGRRYDPTTVTGESRPVRSAEYLKPNEFDRLANVVGVKVREASGPKRLVAAETPEEPEGKERAAAGRREIAPADSKSEALARLGEINKNGADRETFTQAHDAARALGATADEIDQVLGVNTNTRGGDANEVAAQDTTPETNSVQATGAESPKGLAPVKIVSNNGQENVQPNSTKETGSGQEAPNVVQEEGQLGIENKNSDAYLGSGQKGESVLGPVRRHAGLKILPKESPNAPQSNGGGAPQVAPESAPAQAAEGNNAPVDSKVKAGDEEAGVPAREVKPFDERFPIGQRVEYTVPGTVNRRESGLVEDYKRDPVTGELFAKVFTSSGAREYAGDINDIRRVQSQGQEKKAEEAIAIPPAAQSKAVTPTSEIRGDTEAKKVVLDTDRRGRYRKQLEKAKAVLEELPTDADNWQRRDTEIAVKAAESKLAGNIHLDDSELRHQHVRGLRVKSLRDGSTGTIISHANTGDFIIEWDEGTPARSDLGAYQEDVPERGQGVGQEWVVPSKEYVVLGEPQWEVKGDRKTRRGAYQIVRAVKPKGYKPQPNSTTPAKTGQGSKEVKPSAPVSDGWQTFDENSGTLGIPRASMPQIQSEHRGAMVQFLKGRGISHEQVEVRPDSLKPTQAEYNPEKVEKARNFEGPDRSILISSDGHVLDGHHQWLAALDKAPNKPYSAIRFDAPIKSLLLEAARFPSSGVDESTSLPPAGKTKVAEQPSETSSPSSPTVTESRQKRDEAQRRASEANQRAKGQKKGTPEFNQSIKEFYDAIDEREAIDDELKKQSAKPSVSDIFDEEFDKMFGEEVKTKNLKDVAQGLNDLFGGKPLKSAVAEEFDEAKYAQARPLFEAGIKHLGGDMSDPRASVRELLSSLRSQFGMEPEVIQRMKPYIVRFIEQSEGENRIDKQEKTIDRAAKQEENKPDVGTSEQPDREGEGDGRESRPVGQDSAEAPARDESADVRGTEEEQDSEELPDRAAGEREGQVRPTRGARNKPASGARTGDGRVSDTELKERQKAAQEGKDATHQTAPALSANYRITDPDAHGTFTPVVKYNNNIAAYRLVKQLEEEGRQATPEEQEVLAKWTGWGSLPQAFHPWDQRFTPQSDQSAWGKRGAELRQLLGDKEYESLRASVLNAHYTSGRVVEAMWQMVKRLGFSGGRVLEPSVGSGNFFGLMPDEMKGRGTALYGVELDIITAAIAKQLYPAAKVEQAGFQDVAFPDNFFDLAISNVPFGDFKVYDKLEKQRNKLNANIHDYFFLKSVDKTREGGLVVFITSTGTMDKLDPSIRQALAKKAELVSSMRLPEGIFGANAGTQVVTDIIILKKRKTAATRINELRVELGDANSRLGAAQGTLEEARRMLSLDPSDANADANESALNHVEHYARVKERLEREIAELQAGKEDADDLSWLDAVPAMTPGGEQLLNQKGEQIGINEYYNKHPDQILGTLDTNSRLYGKGSLHVTKTDDFEKRFEDAIKRLPRDTYEPYRDTGREFVPEVLPAPGHVKEGGYVAKGGKLYQREGGGLVEQQRSDKDRAVIEGTLKVRDALRSLLLAEDEGQPHKVGAARKELGAQYDAFVKKHGYLHKSTNARAFADDPDSNVLLGLEEWDPAAKKAAKSPIFTESTTRRYEKPSKADSPAAAAAISLNETASISLPRVAELLDTTEKEAADRLIRDGIAFRDPSAGVVSRDEYLTGNVRSKLYEAREALKVSDEYQANVDALEAVQPADVDYEEIEVQLGAGWIPPSDMTEFLASLVDGRPDDFRVAYSPTNGWTFRYSNDGERRHRRGNADTQLWGTKEVGLIKIIEAAAKNKPIVVTDKDDDGKTYVLQKETEEANAKVAAMRERFSEWIWDNPERRKRLHRYYNDNFNNVIPYEPTHPIYSLGGDAASQAFPGMAREIDGKQFALRPHQANAAWMTVTKGTALYAHEVGTGKTYTMAAAAMELKRLGLAKKPAIIVPRSRIDATVREIQELYPNARILATGSKFTGTQRKRTIARMALGSYDVVVMTHPNIDGLPMRPETEEKFIRDEIAELDEVLEQLRANTESSDRAGKSMIKRMEKARKRLVQRIAKALGDARSDDAVFFEETGIDALFVDEAHFYKALPVYTMMQNVGGIPTRRSQRATRMFMRARWLQERNGGRGVVFATGTPIANTMVEFYTMQKYLQYEDLYQRGIHTFDAWASVYGRVVSRMETLVTGAEKVKQRFAEFINLPELVQLSRQVMDVKFASDMPDIVRPEAKIEPVTTPQSTLQSTFQAEIQRRAKALRGPAVKGGDNMLRISSDARKAAVDMRLVFESAPDDPDSKLNVMVRKVLGEYNEAPKLTQMIFSDIGVNPTKKKREADDEGDPEEIVVVSGEDDVDTDIASDSDFEVKTGFSLYDDIIRKLVAGGIPRDKIINFSKLSDAERAGASERLKSGDALIGLGSTGTLGTGVNAQDHLVALHHLDAPWMPAEVEQRDGRGVRQGNRNKQVRVYRYVTLKSFDQFLWETLDRKAKFIKQAMKGDLKVRKVQDDDEGDLMMDAGAMAAIASGNPYALKRRSLTKQVEDLEKAEARHKRNQQSMKGLLEENRHELVRLKNVAAAVSKDAARAAEMKGADFSIKIGSKVYTDRKEANAAMRARVMDISRRSVQTYRGVEESVGEFKGFRLDVRVVNGGTPNAQIVGEEPYPYNISTESLTNEGDGGLRSVDAVISNLKARSERWAEKVAQLEKNITATEAELGQPFKKAGQLKAKKEELAEVGRLYREAGGAGENAEGEEQAASSSEGEAPLKMARAAVKNPATFKGKPFWIGMASTQDGQIEEVHTYEEAEDHDFHHSLYFSPGRVERADEGDLAIFWLDDKGKVQIWPTFGTEPGKMDADFVRLLESQIKRVSPLKMARPDSHLRAVENVGNLVPQVTSERSGNIVTLNSEGAEIMRRAMVPDEESLQSAASLDGAFLEPKQVREAVKALKGTASDMLDPEFGYSEQDAAPLRSLAENLTAAARERKGTVVVKVKQAPSSVEPHETFHQGSYLGANGKLLEDRHARIEELASHKAVKAWRKYYGATPEYGNASRGVAVEEAASTIAGGDYDKLGLSDEEAHDYLKQWFASYIEKNGEQSVTEFRRQREEVQQIINQTRAQVAAQRGAEDGPANESLRRQSEEPGRPGGLPQEAEGQGEVKTRRTVLSAEAAGAVEKGAISGPARYYTVKSRDAAEAQAQSHIESIGLDAAITQALLPGEASAERTALRMEVSKLLGRQGD